MTQEQFREIVEEMTPKEKAELFRKIIEKLTKEKKKKLTPEKTVKIFDVFMDFLDSKSPPTPTLGLRN